MDTQNTTGLRPRFPVVTLAVVTAAVIVAMSPTLQAMLVYDRSAILGGQFWRLFTGHWVHFSTKHLVYDTSVFAIAGWVIEGRGYKNFGRLCLWSPVVIGVSLLLFAPHLGVFGGLSGVGTAAVTYCALAGLDGERRWKRIGTIVLGLTAAKIFLEFTHNGFVFMDFGDAQIHSVPLNHFMGALTACLIYIVTKPTDHASDLPASASSGFFSPADPYA